MKYTARLDHFAPHQHFGAVQKGKSNTFELNASEDLDTPLTLMFPAKLAVDQEHNFLVPGQTQDFFSVDLALELGVSSAVLAAMERTKPFSLFYGNLGEKLDGTRCLHLTHASDATEVVLVVRWELFSCPRIAGVDSAFGRMFGAIDFHRSARKKVDVWTISPKSEISYLLDLAEAEFAKAEAYGDLADESYQLNKRVFRSRIEKLAHEARKLTGASIKFFENDWRMDLTSSDGLPLSKDLPVLYYDMKSLSALEFTVNELKERPERLADLQDFAVCGGLDLAVGSWMVPTANGAVAELV